MRKLVTLVAAFACCSLVVLAQNPPGGGAAAGPYIEFRLIKAGQTTGGTVGDDLKSGTPVNVIFTAKQSLCESTFGGAKLPVPDDARTVVKLSAELLGQKDGVYSVRLLTQHLRTAGQTGAEAPLEQNVSMREGDRVVLDMLRDPVPVPGCDTQAVTLEARLLVKPDPALARALYTADVWLVHRDETGHEWNQHVTMNVNGTAETPILFNDVTFPLPKLDPNQDNFTAFVRVTGTLRARARTDGHIDLDVSTARLIGLLPDNLPPGISGSSTKKTITVQADETTAIEIPQPGSGFVMRALRAGEKMPGASGIGIVGAGAGGSDPLAARPGVFINAGRFILNTGVFFKDHQTRVLIRVHKAQVE
jgi:hypothetical protein